MSLDPWVPGPVFGSRWIYTHADLQKTQTGTSGQMVLRIEAAHPISHRAPDWKALLCTVGQAIWIAPMRPSGGRGSLFQIGCLQIIGKISAEGPDGSELHRNQKRPNKLQQSFQQQSAFSTVSFHVHATRELHGIFGGHCAGCSLVEILDDQCKGPQGLELGAGCTSSGACHS